MTLLVLDAAPKMLVCSGSRNGDGTVITMCITERGVYLGQPVDYTVCVDYGPDDTFEPTEASYTDARDAVLTELGYVLP